MNGSGRFFDSLSLCYPCFLAWRMHLHRFIFSVSSRTVLLINYSTSPMTTLQKLQQLYITISGPAISCDEVLPILDSIIERRACALKHFQFPKVCCEDRNAESNFHTFLTRYYGLLERRRVSYLNCDCDTYINLTLSLFLDAE